MWRETDSWFELQFLDNSQGFAQLDADGNYICIYRADGTPIAVGENIEYTCVDMNAAAPSWAD